MSILSVAIETSAKMKEECYHIVYKNMSMLYRISDNPIYTDTVSAYIGGANKISNVYDLITEFARAFAYHHELYLSVSPGIIANNIPESRLLSYTGGYAERRKIPIYESMDTFFFVSLIDTEDKSNLLRLYTEAFSSSNIYHEILFYWHCIVYPHKSHDFAVKYINDSIMVDDYFSKDVQEITSGHVFSKNTVVDFGMYIKDNIRHSLAHIVRDRGDASNIRVDDWSQTRELALVSNVLQRVARNKLDNDYSLSTCAGRDVFTVKRIPAR